MADDAFQLFNGDCLELMRYLPAGSVDLVLADLPYGTTQNRWDSVIPLPPLWKEYWRVCRGAVVLTAQTPFDKLLGASQVRRLKYEWIWEKTEATGHLNAKKMPMKAHENVLVFYRSLPTYNPQKTSGHVRKTATRVNAKHSSNYGAQSEAPPYDSSERYPRSVQVFPSVKHHITLHPTQKPVALMEYLIRTYTNEGDTVLDNTMGSGTTGVACANTGRRFIGIEKEPEYFVTAETRVKTAFGALISSIGAFA